MPLYDPKTFRAIGADKDVAVNLLITYKKSLLNNIKNSRNKIRELNTEIDLCLSDLKYNEEEILIIDKAIEAERQRS